MSETREWNRANAVREDASYAAMDPREVLEHIRHKADVESLRLGAEDGRGSCLWLHRCELRLLADTLSDLLRAQGDNG